MGGSSFSNVHEIRIRVGNRKTALIDHKFILSQDIDEQISDKIGNLKKFSNNITQHKLKNIYGKDASIMSKMLIMFWNARMPGKVMTSGKFTEKLLLVCFG